MAAKFTCPVCGWKGARLAKVERAPRAFAPLACPGCGCYLRDCFLWLMLQQRQASSKEKLLILEVGGTKRLGQSLAKTYFYRNADLIAGAEGVDYRVSDGYIEAQDNQLFTVAIISFVLSEIVQKSVRRRLLCELRRLVASEGYLIVFDDIDLKRLSITMLDPNRYFHLLRFGRNILLELAEAGWGKIVKISGVRESSVYSRVDFPIIIGQPGAARIKSMRLDTLDKMNAVFA